MRRAIVGVGVNAPGYRRRRRHDMRNDDASFSASARRRSNRLLVTGAMIRTSSAPRLVDWRGRFRGATPLLLLPRSTDAGGAIVRAAVAHRVPLVPQGGNTGLVGGGIPAADGSAVLLSAWRGSTVSALSMPMA